MDPFIGQISIVGFNFAPRNWALCDGQLLPISQYQALYALLGTTYGGDGRTTFQLPDLRGRAATGPDGGLRLGEKFGIETVTLTEAQMPAHAHTLQANTSLANADLPVGALPAARPRGGPLMYAAADPASTVEMNPSTVAQAGGGQAHDNMQPHLALNFVIALTGVFPSRN